MGTVNNNPIPRAPRTAVVTWGNSHKNIFVTNAAAIGLSTSQANAYKNAVDDLVAKLAAQEDARNAARTATTNADKSFATMLSTQGDTIRLIRAFAEATSNPQAVYTLAQIPPVATPTPLAPPAQPTKLTVSLDAANGFINLAWKASNPDGSQGTSYIVKRKLPTETAFSFIGVTGVKKFVDKTFFAGPDSVQYTVQGQRSDSSGPVSEVFTVNFGQAPGGGLAAFVGEETSAAVGMQQAKLAA